MDLDFDDTPIEDWVRRVLGWGSGIMQGQQEVVYCDGKHRGASRILKK